MLRKTPVPQCLSTKKVRLGHFRWRKGLARMGIEHPINEVRKTTLLARFLSAVSLLLQIGKN